MEILWDLHFIYVKWKKRKAEAFLCISALDALADYSALAATT